MHVPRDVLGAARERASEITWWNRRLTKLRQHTTAPNLDEFLEGDLIQTKGPYLEFVEPPAKDSVSAQDRLDDLGVRSSVIDALTQVLFSGDGSGKLYRHQAEMIESIESGVGTNILTVPTATGKTESFLIPVLDSCVSTDADGLKSLIVYPTKTLAVDQLNRIVSYVNTINKNRSEEDEVSVGIWDSDTPRGIGTRSFELESGAYVRGLEDPYSGNKLQVDEDGVPVNGSRSFPWLKVTRNRIEDGVDILLTNPEAIDHLMVSNNKDSRSILGANRGEAPLQHIVYDEAHVWSGIMGAGINLLNQRLKHFFDTSNPQISLVSATLKNPEQLAQSLTDTDEVVATDFTPAHFDIPDSSQRFRAFPQCDVSAIAGALVYVQLAADGATGQVDPPESVTNAVTALETIGTVSTAPQIGFDLQNGEWLQSATRRAIQSVLSTDGVTTPEECFSTRRGRERVARNLLDDAQTDSQWRDYLTTTVPELPLLIDWFRGGTIGPVGFRHLDDVENYLLEQSGEGESPSLETILALGRLAGMVTDRHHAFVKPPRAIYQCRSCNRLSASDKCVVCDCVAVEIRFCRSCHHPFSFSNANDEDDGGTYIPLSKETPVTRCPDCSSKIRGSDIGVPTSSLLSYMLSEMVKETPSSKTLVFSDSHSAAESVAKRIQTTEYGLMAETLYVKALLERGGVAQLDELHTTVSKQLLKEYFEPFRDPNLNHTGAAYDMVVRTRNRISDQANLYNTDHLLKSAIVTSDVVYEEASTAFELAIGHALYTRLAGDDYVKFSKDGITLYCLTVDKVYERIADDIGTSVDDVEPTVNKFLQALHEAGIIHEEDFDTVRSRVNSQADTDEQASAIREYLIEQGDKFQEIVGLDLIESGLIVHKYKRDNAPLRLIPSIGFCRDCYRTLPATSDRKCLDECPNCGSTLSVYDRFSVGDDGEYTGDGVAPVDDSTDYALDHWAHDIMRPLNRTDLEDDLPFVTVGIHKGNIPATLRGAIEEGFRKDDPTINIVSSTPTMELGVDIGTLETVAQVGMPPTLTNYVQRAGRTGRSQGSSSLVTTVIRGQHPVDAHYYEDLTNRFFDEFDPVRVPEATEFTHIVAAHVVVEVFTYLAHNPHQSNVFERRYELANSDFTAAEAVDAIEDNLTELVELVTGEWEERLRDHIEEVFGQPGLEAFEAVFLQPGSLNLLHRVKDVYGPLRDTDETVDGDTIDDEAGRLNLWLDQLGYLASYRNFGQDFPVEIEGYRDGVSFESEGRLYDMFPGPRNEPGALFTLSGTDYLVNDATGGRVLTTTNICANDECEWPFQSYSTSESECPHCGTPLEETTVHKIESIQCREAKGGERNWTTSPLQTSRAEYLETRDATKTGGSVLGVDSTLLTGSFEITNFVYAYERFHPSSDGAKILQSEAEIHSMSEDAPSYAPIGTQYTTSGIRIEFPMSEVAAAFGSDTVRWPQFLVSLQQACKRAIAIQGQFDLADFDVMVNLVDDTLQLTVTDGREGGTGVAWRLREFLREGFTDQLEQIANCNNCQHYCEECLLLPRTPASYLESGLLDRQPLVKFLN
ncbi:DEAD/DEAH box helicase [Haloarchaeobius sp. DFWS5]|uniref:DEAD/DEAH box helicase n=1 Tax=Haloarchaeobius sp. DFWS5 TaxID=3446114 RepID=UPI003EB903B6